MSDIQRLFQEDPLNLTDPNLDEMIAYYREKRNAFTLGDKQAGSTKRMKAEAGPKITDLSDILNEII